MPLFLEGRKMDGQQKRLFIAYLPLARKIASRYWTLPYEDRVQEALVGLAIAVHGYRGDGDGFAAYARTVIGNRLNAMYRAELKHYVVYFSFDDEDEEEVDGVPVPGEEELGYDEVEQVLSFLQVIARSGADGELVKMRMAGLNQQQCADGLGKDRSTVSRMLAGIRKIFVGERENG